MYPSVILSGLNSKLIKEVPLLAQYDIMVWQPGSDIWHSGPLPGAGLPFEQSGIYVAEKGPIGYELKLPKFHVCNPRTAWPISWACKKLSNKLPVTPSIT